MKNVAIAIMSVILGVNVVYANVVCEQQLDEKRKVTVEIDAENNAAIVTRLDGEEIKFQEKITDLHGVWDGHASGLITGKKFALKYSSFFGCIKHVTFLGQISKGILTEMNFPACKGGLTPDDHCI